MTQATTTVLDSQSAHGGDIERLIKLLIERGLLELTILWDYDNTLGKTEKPAFQACCRLTNEILRNKWTRATKKGRRRKPKQFTPHELEHAFVGSSFRKIITQLAATYGFTLEDDELERYVEEEVNRVVARFLQGVEATEGVNVLLALLKHLNVNQAVASSSALRRVQACIDGAGQRDFFVAERVFSAACLKSSKPDPLICNHTVEKLGVKKENCVAVEDSENGVKAWVAAGIRVIGYVGAYPEAEREERARQLLACGAVTVINNWSQFLEALLSLEPLVGNAQ